MYINKLKNKLKTTNHMTTMAYSKGYVPLVEICGKAGIDSIVFDAEHSTLSQAECEELIRASEAVGIVPLVRTRKNDQALMLRYLDAGAMGILVPNVRTAQEARDIVKNIKYHPDGNRGLSVTRASDWGLLLPLSEYVKMANDQIMIILMIENKEAVDNLEEILAVEGVDGLMIGTTDLSQSLGHPGNGKASIVQDYVKKAEDIALKSGKYVGSMLREGESCERYHKKGYRMLTINLMSFYTAGIKKFIQDSKVKE